MTLASSTAVLLPLGGFLAELSRLPSIARE